MNQLGSHTLKSYDNQLHALMQSILGMGAQVRRIVELAKRSLHERSESLVDEAKAADKIINELDHKLENEATTILALQNPLANDLRFVTSALKIAGVLERAGDLAKNTVKRSIKLEDYASDSTVKRLEQMADIVIEMLNDSLSAVAERDVEKAISVWKRDDAVDELYHTIFSSMQEEMRASSAVIPQCTHIVFMAKNFERIADYCTNLAKTVHYVLTGRHADKSLLKN